MSGADTLSNNGLDLLRHCLCTVLLRQDPRHVPSVLTESGPRQHALNSGADLLGSAVAFEADAYTMEDDTSGIVGLITDQRDADERHTMR